MCTQQDRAELSSSWSISFMPTGPSYLELDESTLYHGLKLARLLELISKRRIFGPS
jgi:hypothetical protein